MNPALPMASLITPAAASRGSSVASTERGAPAATAPATIAFGTGDRPLGLGGDGVRGGVGQIERHVRTLPVAQNSSCPTV